MNEFRIVVYGIPGPQGSKRHVGNGVMVESSKKVKPWRQDVTAAAVAFVDAWRTRQAGLVGNLWQLLDGPLVVDMVFTFARPNSHYRTGRNAHLLRDAAPARPAGTPDLSKLARSTEDALTKRIWTDDARIVEYGRLAKVYAREDVDALDSPGAIIRIRPLIDDIVHAEIIGDNDKPMTAAELADHYAQLELEAPVGVIRRTGRNYAAETVNVGGGFL